MAKKRTAEQVLERDEVGRKRCYDCFEWKKENCFNIRSNERDGLARICKDCRAIQRISSQYNVSVEWVRRQLADLDGRCPICTDNVDVWCVDHDHACCPESKKSCGRCVRGLVCGRCNVGIAMFRDRPEVLEVAAQFLRTKRALDRVPF